MSRRTLALLVPLLAALCLGCATTGDGRLNLDREGVALGGYDPVSYHRRGPVPGSPRFTTRLDGATFRFESEESRTRFLQSPEYYLPLYGGWCAWAMADGEKVEVDPTCFLATDDGLLLFYRSFLIDTRERWQRDDPARKKALADEHWRTLEREAALTR